jgi:hypothetical protein
VARGGIEPPTRGFSVRRRARFGPTKRKSRNGFWRGQPNRATRPSLSRTGSPKARPKTRGPDPVQRSRRSATELLPNLTEPRRVWLPSLSTTKAGRAANLTRPEWLGGSNREFTTLDWPSDVTAIERRRFRRWLPARPCARTGEPSKVASSSPRGRWTIPDPASRLRDIEWPGAKPQPLRRAGGVKWRSNDQRVLIAPRSHARNSRIEPNREAPTAASAGA